MSTRWAGNLVSRPRPKVAPIYRTSPHVSPGRLDLLREQLQPGFAEPPESRGEGPHSAVSRSKMLDQIRRPQGTHSDHVALGPDVQYPMAVALFDRDIETRGSQPSSD